MPTAYCPHGVPYDWPDEAEDRCIECQRWQQDVEDFTRQKYRGCEPSVFSGSIYA